jgi:hypothetical protein
MNVSNAKDSTVFDGAEFRPGGPADPSPAVWSVERYARTTGPPAEPHGVGFSQRSGGLRHRLSLLRPSGMNG